MLSTPMQTHNIYLTSAGFNDLSNYVTQENVDLFKSLSQDKKVLIIGNAAPEGTGNYPARERVKQNFLNVGASQVDIVEITQANMQILQDYDVLYGIGGDPYYLIQLVNETNFKDALTKFLVKGVYIGESAGSMILCDDLEWAYIVKRGTKPKYDIQLETYKGLGMTEHKAFPHWGKVSEVVKEKVAKYEAEHSTTLTKLNDGDVVEVWYENL